MLQRLAWQNSATLEIKKKKDKLNNRLKKKMLQLKKPYRFLFI